MSRRLSGSNDNVEDEISIAGIAISGGLGDISLVRVQDWRGPDPQGSAPALIDCSRPNFDCFKDVTVEEVEEEQNEI